MSGPYENSLLTGILLEAAEYAVAKVVALELISCDDAGVRAIARETVSAVVDELASREQQVWEATPVTEMTSSRDECVVRISDYQGVVKDLKEPR